MNNKLKRWALIAMVSIFVSLVFSLLLDIYNDWFDLLSVSMMTATFTIGFSYMADRHDKRLTARMMANQSIMWNVRMNSVEVGKVSDSQYAAMQRMAFHDGRLALAQFFNLGRIALVVFEKFLVAVPLLVFWAAVAIAIFSPESFTDMVREFQKADSTAIKSAMLLCLQTALIAMLIVFGVMVVIGYRFGFRNHYNEEVNRMLKQHCNTPVDGDIQLWQIARDPISNQKVASSPY